MLIHGGASETLSLVGRDANGGMCKPPDCCYLAHSKVVVSLYIDDSWPELGYFCLLSLSMYAKNGSMRFGINTEES